MAGSQGRPTLGGLQSLYGQRVHPVPEENILSRSGAPADPRHGQNQTGNVPYLTAPYPNAGTQGAYGPSALEDPYTGTWALPADVGDRDQSPITHGGPFPAHGAAFGELRNGEAQWADQRAGMDAHSADFGAVEAYTMTDAHDFEGAHFRNERWESQGLTVLDSVPVPMPYLTGAGGGRDRQVLGNGGNPHFSVGHYQRNYQTDGVPYNRQWLDAVQRPFIVKANGVKAVFDGPDSPYGASGDETNNMMLSPDQAAVMTNATAYSPPADPTVAPSYADATSWAW